MTATRTKVDEVAQIDLTPLPEVTEVVAVGVLHGSRQQRAALVSVVEQADDLELLVEGDPAGDLVAELARTMPDVAVVDVDVVGAAGIAAIADQLPAVAIVAVSDDDTPALGEAVLAGAISAATTSSGGIDDIDVVIREAFSRRSVLTKGAAAGVWSAVDTAGLVLDPDDADLLLDLAAGRDLADLAAATNRSRTSCSSQLATMVARIRATVR